MADRDWGLGMTLAALAISVTLPWHYHGGSVDNPEGGRGMASGPQAFVGLAVAL